MARRVIKTIKAVLGKIKLPNLMPDSLVSLDVGSPKELNRELDRLLKHHTAGSRFLVLNIHGPKVLARMFELPKTIAQRELRQVLLLEAVELLRLTPGEVELDYQVLYSTADKMKGLLVTAPKKVIDEYIACCDKKGFMPIKITTGILSVAEALIYKNALHKKSFCVVNFPEPNYLQVVTFDTGRCVLLRDIYYDDVNEAEQELGDSLKYSFSKSGSKRLERVYLSGDIADNEELVSRLEKELEVKTESVDGLDLTQSATLADNLCRINLGKRYAVSFVLRKRLLHAANLAIAVFALLCLLLSSAVSRIACHWESCVIPSIRMSTAMPRTFRARLSHLRNESQIIKVIS